MVSVIPEAPHPLYFFPFCRLMSCSYETSTCQPSSMSFNTHNFRDTCMLSKNVPPQIYFNLNTNQQTCPGENVLLHNLISHPAVGYTSPYSLDH